MMRAGRYRLKRKAKLLARREAVQLHDALDRVAAHEGYRAWSLLAGRVQIHAPARLTP